MNDLWSDSWDNYRHRMDDDFRNMGKWVDPTRTKEKFDHPYDYSEFFIFGSRAIIEDVDGAVYTDRMSQWDHDKYTRLWKEHCKDEMNQQVINATYSIRNVPVDNLSAFMSAWEDKAVRVVALAEGCNQSNGYPYWIIWWNNVKPELNLEPLKTVVPVLDPTLDK